MPATTHCPTCRRDVVWGPESPHRPFCSDRCRLIDLGAWFSGAHAIPDDGSSEEFEEGAPDTDAPPRRPS
jgi:endogenous inhibitor of DNA gyrase (YacG/DUF329 family)